MFIRSENIWGMATVRKLDAAVKGLCGAAKDKENGGWYSSITPDGGYVDNKLCYVHAFVILAASDALLAGHPKGEELLQDALDTYDRYFWNEEDGMACDTWNTEFTCWILVIEDLNANDAYSGSISGRNRCDGDENTG